jgi:hypothetical protein
MTEPDAFVADGFPPVCEDRIAMRHRADGSLLSSVRAGVGVLLALAVANGIFLYVLAGRADTDYAWPIRPSASAAFMGAGYLAGAAATGLVVFAARRWRSVQPLALALVVLSVLLLAATVLHAGKFRWSYPPTWIWTGVYASAPIAVAMAMRRQRAITERPAADRSLGVLRSASLLAGVALLVIAALFYLAPARFGAHWPWPLTPLLARVVASWFAMIATAQLWCAADLRRAHEALIPYTALAVWCVALLAIPALHHGELTRTGPVLIAYVAGLGALLALAAYGIARADRSAL